MCHKYPILAGIARNCEARQSSCRKYLLCFLSCIDPGVADSGFLAEILIHLLELVVLPEWSFQGCCLMTMQSALALMTPNHTVWIHLSAHLISQ